MRRLAVACVLAACRSAPEAPAPPSAGMWRTDARGVEQVWVPPGTFRMGADDAGPVEPPDWAARELPSEGPAHAVTLTRGFWIDRTEVTRRAFQAFVDDGGYEREGLWSAAGRAWLRQAGRAPPPAVGSEGADLPRVGVTWYEAEAYAKWRGGRLPSEAEWEFAARGPGSSLYPWGDAWDPDRANVVGSEGLVPVGSYPAGASWIGALDLAGNAMEWVADWLDAGYYADGPPVDPPGPTSGTHKAEKGGWWGGPAFVARASYRHFEDPPHYRDQHIGFRVVAP